MTRNPTDDLQRLKLRGQRCRKNLLALLELWPVAEMSWKIGFELRTESDKRAIRKVLHEAEQLVKMVFLRRARRDRCNIEEILTKLRFAVLEDDFKENACEDVRNLMDEALSLIPANPSQSQSTLKQEESPVIVQKGTAFILMAFGEHPELVDTYNTIRRVCGAFGFQALRADDIQHQGKIMDQVKKYIATAELLIADLSGETPNVYFEVGCAQMAGREPILFRKHGTRLHFDLAAYNVPQYKSFAELENLLGNRLQALRECGNYVTVAHTH